MGDHFVLLVDRLLTESTLEAAIESQNRALQATTSTMHNCNVDDSSVILCIEDKKPSGKLGECRICQDEDEVSNMETPCSCSGSLKYAHRRCVQRWCNEKRNTICEICHQDFKPGYTAPPPLFQFGRIPMSFRGNWEISRRDLNSPQFVGMVATDRSIIASDYDEYPVSTAGNVLCCRSVAIIFMALLVLRHTLPLVISANNDYSIPLFLMLLFRTVGIVVPIYFISRAFTSIQRRRQQREPSNFSVDSDDEETESSAM